MNRIKQALRTSLTAMCVAFAATLTAAFTTVPAGAEARPQTPQATGGQRTTLHIGVAVERHDIVAGPYARYAQKYLGVAAPLADKVLHEVTNVKISELSDIPVPDSNRERDTHRAPSHMNPEHGFPRLTVDKTSSAPVSLEESARLAAEKIFEIRRSRPDLITGEVGENVFGGGLGSALAELSRLEEEYLSLFLGKQTSRSDFKQYSVTPTRERLTYTVCRFSETDGLLPEDNLSGVPMVLELKPTADTPAETAAPQAKPNSRAVPRLIPAQMQCRIILDGVELASELFSIEQLGQTVWVQ